ncbi:MAG: hypothetical protein ACREH4_11705 [Vitreimonas sp.]
MGRRDILTALMMAAALGACAELTAEAPLFAVSDQIGPPPLTEGVWIAVGEDCPAYYARRRTGRFPEGCWPMELRTGEGGAWRMRPRVDLISNLSAQERAQTEADFGPARAIVAPAVENPPVDGYSPLYVAEFDPEAEDHAISYAVIAPIGAMPATSAMVIGSIGCADILRDGPIEGVTVQYEEPTPAREGAALTSSAPDERAPPAMSGCIAAAPAAVREAARRAVIQNLGELTQVRFVYVRAH